MREFQERRQIRRFLHSRYAIAILVIICAFLVQAAIGVYGKYEKSKALVQKTERDLEDLKQRQKTISALSDSLNTDQGKEREIRDRFGLIKEGERVIVIVDETSATETSSEDESINLWQRFLNLFK